MLSSMRSRLRGALTAALVPSLALSFAPAADSFAESPLRSSEAPASAVTTVKLWFEYLEDGKWRRAWKLIAKPSRSTIGGFEEFKGESSAWAEGWGAWAAAKKRGFELRVIAPMDDDAASVVTVTGRVAQEGPYRRRAAALPVQTHDGVTKVDPAHGKAVIWIVRPKGGDTGSRPRFKAVVKHIRARYNSVFFTVKDSKLDPLRARLKKTGRRAYRAILRWPRHLGPGRHVLSVATWGRAGFKADAMYFTVHR